MFLYNFQYIIYRTYECVMMITLRGEVANGYTMRQKQMEALKCWIEDFRIETVRIQMVTQ